MLCAHFLNACISICCLFDNGQKEEFLFIVVLIYIYIITSIAEHLFMYRLAIFMFFFILVLEIRTPYKTSISHM